MSSFVIFYFESANFTRDSVEASAPREAEARRTYLSASAGFMPSAQRAATASPKFDVSAQLENEAFGGFLAYALTF